MSESRSPNPCGVPVLDIGRDVQGRFRPGNPGGPGNPFARKVAALRKALLDSVSEIQADHNPKLKVEGIVVNQFQPRAVLPQRTVQELVDEGLPVLQPYLSSSVKIKESHELARPMVHLDPRHKVTQEFVALYEALD